VLTGAPLFFWIHDLWPESLSATGAINSGFALDMVGKITSWIYRGCDRILIQSQAFRESVARYGARPEQVYYLPNCAEDYFQPVTLPQDAPERDLMPEGFRIMFAGNVGVAQDFETILAAAELTQSQPPIQWVIVGDGRNRPWAEEQIQQRKLGNVRLLGRHDKERMPAFFSLADVMLVSLKRDPIFALTVPAKVQAYLACGKPIIASLDGEGARIIEEAKAGLAVPSESPELLAEAARTLSLLDASELAAVGINARAYFDAHFSRAHLMDVFEGWLEEISGGHGNS
jgi:glycosyltransferase involved in cell wall biosynthesis